MLTINFTVSGQLKGEAETFIFIKKTFILFSCNHEAQEMIIKKFQGNLQNLASFESK